jgi:hypothetical protein
MSVPAVLNALFQIPDFFPGNPMLTISSSNFGNWARTCNPAISRRLNQTLTLFNPTTSLAFPLLSPPTTSPPPSINWPPISNPAISALRRTTPPSSRICNLPLFLATLTSIIIPAARLVLPLLSILLNSFSPNSASPRPNQPTLLFHRNSPSLAPRSPLPPLLEQRPERSPHNPISIAPFADPARQVTSTALPVFLSPLHLSVSSHCKNIRPTSPR